METQQMYNEYAHVMTMKDFKKQIGDSFIKMQKNPKTQQEFKEALDFALDSNGICDDNLKQELLNSYQYLTTHSNS